MKHMKKAFALIFTLALVIAAIPGTESGAKAKTTTVTVGSKVTLKIKKPTSYKWTSSNKKVATVSKKGVVTGKKAGSCTITATNKKNKKKTKFAIKVEKKSLNPKNMGVSVAGTLIHWLNDPMEGVVIYLDGMKVSREIFKNENGPDGVNYFFYLTEDRGPVSEGDHYVVFRKSGYKEYSFSFTYTKPDFSNQGLIVEDVDGDKWWTDDNGVLWVNFNPDSQNQNLTITIDGEDVTSKGDYFLNESGAWQGYFPNLTLTKGSHTLSAKADNYPEETITLDIE